MRVARFESDGRRGIGIVTDTDLADITATGLPEDTVELIADWDSGVVADAMSSAPRRAHDEVRRLAPRVPRKNIIAVGRNYRDHAAEFSASGFDASEKQVIPDDPVIFTKATTSVIGPDDPIVLANDPTGTTDYEGEMAIVVGRPGRNISEADALDYVFGWTIVNDVTARDLQKRHVQWFIGKSPDTFAPWARGLSQSMSCR
jgi:2-keto-4-pentenoate hydratase/2-oxohepta-3-ene-1,7-dioic acid hydratase in catechol pathway